MIYNVQSPLYSTTADPVKRTQKHLYIKKKCKYLSLSLFSIESCKQVNCAEYVVPDAFGVVLVKYKCVVIIANKI